MRVTHTPVFFFFPLSFFDNVPVVSCISSVKTHTTKAVLAIRSTFIITGTASCGNTTETENYTDDTNVFCHC